MAQRLQGTIGTLPVACFNRVPWPVSYLGTTSGNIVSKKNRNLLDSLENIEAMNNEADNGQYKSGPGCEVEKLATRCLPGGEADSHADSSTEIQDLKENTVNSKLS